MVKVTVKNNQSIKAVVARAAVKVTVKANQKITGVVYE